MAKYRHKMEYLDGVERVANYLHTAGLLTSPEKSSDIGSPINKTHFYHNTRLLLSKYRTMRWHLETAGEEIASRMDLPETSTIDKLIDSVRDLIDLYDDTTVEHRLQSLEKTREMLQYVDRGLARLKKYPDRGLEKYNVLYYTYIDPDTSKTPVDIYLKLKMSRSGYYALRKEAIQDLSLILWGLCEQIYEILYAVLKSFHQFEEAP